MGRYTIELRKYRTTLHVVTINDATTLVFLLSTQNVTNSGCLSSSRWFCIINKNI